MIRQGLFFSDDEKEECLGLAYRLIDITYDIYEQGLFGLRTIVNEKTSNDFMKMAAELLLDEDTSEKLQEIFEYSLLSCNDTSVLLLEKLIIAEAFITVNNTAARNVGMPVTRNVAVAIGAVLGEHHMMQLMKYAESLDFTDVEKIIDEYTAPTAESESFETELFKLSKLQLYYLLTSSASFHTATALQGCDKTLIMRIKNDLPDHDFKTICLTLKYLLPQHRISETIFESQKMILTYLQELKTTGVFKTKINGTVSFEVC